jgi:hypothetical protein
MPTYPLDMPATPVAKQIRMQGNSVVSVSRSPFTGQQQTYVHPANYWSAQVTLPPMRRAQAEPWFAWLAALNGMEGTFYLGDPVGKNPRGYGGAGGTPRINGANQAGYNLAADGWPVNQVVLKLGDYIQVESSLYKVVVHDVGSTATGSVSIAIWPRIRTSPADNAPIIYTNAVGIFRLASNQNAWDWAEGPLGQLSFSAVEAF